MSGFFSLIEKRFRFLNPLTYLTYVFYSKYKNIYIVIDRKMQGNYHFSNTIALKYIFIVTIPRKLERARKHSWSTCQLKLRRAAVVSTK